jgi:hypothetical protein
MSTHKAVKRVMGDPPPPAPSTPPNGTYTSTVTGDLASWSGSFTYTNGAIAYTRTSPSGNYSANNTSNGNAIVFSIDDGTNTITFTGSSFSYQGTKAQYSGNVSSHRDPTGGQDGWSATQT